MAKRFSDLEKRAIAILANGGNPATSNDEALRNYWQWKINPSSAAHNLPEASTRTNGRRMDPRFIKPFSVELAADQFAKVQISRRTDTAAPAAVKTALAYQTLTAAQRSVKLGEFRPAQVYWRTGAATDSATRTSRITNRPYKSYYTGTDEGYTASFGQSGTNSVADQQKAIVTALGNTINLISFSPERYSG